MLDIKSISCAYGENLILENISFQAKKGDIISILGPNGVGKTTLFKSILGLLDKKSGQVLINKKDLSELSDREQAKLIAYVPQAHTPPFPYRVLDVVVMGRASHLGVFESPQKSDYLKAEELITSLGIEDLKDKSYTEISGGERQLVLIARALAQDPDFLIMDEPTSNLDYGNQVRVLDRIKGLAGKNIGIIMTTHFPDHALMVSNKALILKDKKNYSFGDLNQVLDEKTLREIYGINISIKDIKVDGKNIRICLPLI